MKTKVKYRGQTGYMLHNKRLSYTGKDSIRSIKFPLIPNNDSRDNVNTFIENLIFDYEKINGITNISSYYKHYIQKAGSFYSLFDFWVDSLRVGIIWQPSAMKLDDLLCKYYNRPNKAEIAFDNINIKTKDKLIKDKFISEIILSEGFRGKKDVLTFQKKTT